METRQYDQESAFHLACSALRKAASAVSSPAWSESPRETRCWAGFRRSRACWRPAPSVTTHDQHHQRRYPTGGDPLGKWQRGLEPPFAGPENGNPKWMVTGHAPEGNPCSPRSLTR